MTRRRRDGHSEPAGASRRRAGAWDGAARRGLLAPRTASVARPASAVLAVRFFSGVVPETGIAVKSVFDTLGDTVVFVTTVERDRLGVNLISASWCGSRVWYRAAGR
jgi:hypothetical protein